MRSSGFKGLWKSLLVLSTLFVTTQAQAQGGNVGPANAILCGSQIASSFTTTSAFTMVNGQVGKGIFICGYSASTLNTTSQTNFQLTFTTSTPAPQCNAVPPGGASTAITPVHGVTSNAPLVDHIDFAASQVPVVTTTNSPSNLCIITNGTGTNLQFIIYFSQF